MDALCRQKSDEINTCLDPRGWDPPILDIGGGAGTLSRVLIGSKPGGRVVLFELPEVIRAAKILYPDDDDWECFTILTGDFRSHPFENPVRPGMVIMSNFLHAYSPTEAQELLFKALTLLDPEGVALIHDYFPDRLGPYPQKGALYDLNMMLNTFNGVCHPGSRILSWLNAAGFSRIQVLDLTTDSTIIAARKANVARPALKPCDDWPHQAIKFGFRKAVWVASDAVATAPWVRQKCQHGCKSFGKNLQCPPRGLSIEETRNLLQSYHRILLVEGEPPSVNFHRRLLDLERAAFLAGHHKAFVLGAGPCPVCDVCPDNGNCRHPEHARPSMEGCGIDVYKTVQDAGITLKPVLRKNQYIKYFGLLLLE
jgi:predicted metal-binding protein